MLSGKSRLGMLLAVCAALALYAVYARTNPKGSQAVSSGNGLSGRDGASRTIRFSDQALGADEASQLSDFPSLASVEIKRCEIGDEIWEALAGQSELKSLLIDECQFAGRSLQMLKGASQLQHLFLNRVTLDATGWAAVGQLQQLRSLDLTATNITDSDLQHLAELSQLERLYLNGTQISGAGLIAFPENHRLQLLNLSGIPLTVEGIAALRRFSGLTALYLNAVPMNNDLLSTLLQTLSAGHPSLHSLHLAQNALADDAIDTLSELNTLPALSLVSLYETRITKSAFLRLAEQTPDLSYQVDYPTGDE